MNRNVSTGAIPNVRLVAANGVETKPRTRIASVKPLYDRILVRQLDENSTTKGGLIVPTMAQENAAWAKGEVVEVGGGRVSAEGKTVPLQLKAGDIVLYPRKAGLAIPLGDEDGSVPWVLIREGDILGSITIEEVPLIDVVTEVDSSEAGL
jgi:chaperonin GroES